MDRFLPSLRYKLRLLFKSPGFTITAVLILGLGIGVNTAIFSLIDGVLPKPLPFPNPDRLVQITEPYQNDLGTSIDYPDYIDIVRSQRTFDAIAVAGWDGIDPVSFGVSLLCLGVAAILACLLPALRAIRINPITALRE